jgi:hypothetical protein
MSQSQNPNTSHETHLRAALSHAQRLSESREKQTFTPEWSVQAHHVGDMTVLALAMRD